MLQRFSPLSHRFLRLSNTVKATVGASLSSSEQQNFK